MASDGGQTTAPRREPRVVAGRYRITGRLGRGGMGTVWRATDELLRRQVAVKELHLPDAGLNDVDSGKHRDRALREARSVARIRHPHVVVLHDVVEEHGRPWIVMELVDGRSLADVLRDDGPLDPREAARICAAVAGALLAAHQHGIQHRDVKPANVLVEHGTGRVVLTDFGIARVPGSATISDTGSFVGSPEYTAPERMSGLGAGPESDLWSLGALLCAAVDGRSPFHRESIGEIVHAVAIGDITPPTTVGPLLPVVRGLLDRDPARRMAAAEVQTVLMAYAEAGTEPSEAPTPELPTAGTRPPAGGDAVEDPPEAGAVRRTRRPHGRWLAAAVAATLIAVVAGATAALVVVRGQSDGAAHAHGATASASAPVTARPSTTAPARATPTPLAEGSRLYTDPAGFSVALPDGYVRDAERDAAGTLRTYYWSADHGYRFGEREQAPDPRGPFKVMEDQHRRGPKAYKGYRDGFITRTTQAGAEAALWEFTYDGFGDGKGSRRTLDLCWTEDGTMYDVWLSSPVDDTETARSVFAEVRATFHARAGG